MKTSIVGTVIISSLLLVGCGDRKPNLSDKDKSKQTRAEMLSHFLTKEHLKNLTIDSAVILCWERGASKYIVLDDAGDIYAVNGKASGHAKKADWKQAKSLLKDGGEFTVFSDIIQVALKNGCTQYYGR